MQNRPAAPVVSGWRGRFPFVQLMPGVWCHMMPNLATVMARLRQLDRRLQIGVVVVLVVLLLIIIIPVVSSGVAGSQYRNPSDVMRVLEVSSDCHVRDIHCSSFLGSGPSSSPERIMQVLGLERVRLTTRSLPDEGAEFAIAQLRYVTIRIVTTDAGNRAMMVYSR